VIIPAYNRAGLLKRAVESVLRQTFQDFEVIIVDDASTDNTQEIIKEYNDRRINCLRHSANKGGGAARNTGIMAAGGDFIAFLDSDDEWLPQKLEKQFLAFAGLPPAYGLVYTGFWRINGERRRYVPGETMLPISGSVYKSLLNRNFAGTSTALVKKKYLLKAGLFNESLPRFQDWELWLRLAGFCYFYYLEEALCRSHIVPGSISSDLAAKVEATELIFNRYYEDIKKDRKLLADYHFRLGRDLCCLGNMPEGRRHLLQAIFACPRHLKAPLALGLSLGGREVFFSILRSRQG
jgi:glycosyltransferase involved in cell wall biosynthesis